MSHIWVSHVAHMSESCHTYEWVMPHIWVSHATHMSESCHTYEWVMPHIWVNHITYINETRLTHICKGFTTQRINYHTEIESLPQLRISHVAHINETYRTTYRSLLQTIVSFIELFCKRDLQFEGAYWSKSLSLRHTAHMGWLRWVASLHL